MNKIILMGRITQDPELKTTQTGKTVTSFSLAVPKNFNKNETDFINIVAWQHNAEFICNYFAKGSLILIEGELNTRSYTDKYDQKRYIAEVLVNRAEFTGEKKNNEGGPVTYTPAPLGTRVRNGKNSGEQDEDFEDIIEDDDLPF